MFTTKLATSNAYKSLIPHPKLTDYSFFFAYKKPAYLTTNLFIESDFEIFANFPIHKNESWDQVKIAMGIVKPWSLIIKIITRIIIILKKSRDITNNLLITIYTATCSSGHHQSVTITLQ